MVKKIVLLCTVLSLLTFVSAFTIPEKPTGYVNDYANILSVDTKQHLEEELRIFSASTTNEIAVVTIPDLGGDTIEHYATKLFESWKIGTEKNDNGVLLLIAKDERKIRIEVGYGLEGALTDILSKDIIDTKITPAFKQGDYNRGVREGVDAIVPATQGEYKATGDKRFPSLSGKSIEGFLIFAFILLQFLASIFARSKSWWAGGVLGAVIGVIITFFSILGITFIFGIIITVILTILGLVFDYIVSSTYTSSALSGVSIPWWIGGGGFGGAGGRSGSFGGFGGGSSGGGGSSSSW